MCKGGESRRGDGKKFLGECVLRTKKGKKINFAWLQGSN